MCIENGNKILETVSATMCPRFREPYKESTVENARKIKTNTYLYTLEIDSHVCLVKTRVISSSKDSLQDSANLLMFLIEFLLPSDRSFVVFDRRRKFLSELCPAFFELCNLIFHFLEFLLRRGAQFIVHVAI